MVQILTFLVFTAAICCGARAQDGSARGGLVLCKDSLLGMSCNPTRQLFISQSEGALLRQNRKHAHRCNASPYVILQTPHREMPGFIIPRGIRRTWWPICSLRKIAEPLVLLSHKAAIF